MTDQNIEPRSPLRLIRSLLVFLGLGVFLVAGLYVKLWFPRSHDARRQAMAGVIGPALIVWGLVIIVERKCRLSLWRIGWKKDLVGPKAIACGLLMVLVGIAGSVWGWILWRDLI